MPREPRLIPPGVVVHVRCRYVNDEFRMAGPTERAEMLRRAEEAARQTDWEPLHFALMSSHSHWSFFTGHEPLSAFFQPLNTGFAVWLNKREGRHGPVFSARPNVTIIEGRSALGLGAYLHNNPPRAGVVDDPTSSRWTSHRAYVGLEEPPAWLNVELGLQLMDQPPGEAGRRAFAEYVAERSGAPRDPKWSGGDRNGRRKSVRLALGAPVECATPTLLDEEQREFEQPLVAHAEPPIRPRWEGSVREVLEAVAIQMRIPVATLLAHGRRRLVVAARKVCLVLWTEYLGRASVEMSTTLGVSAAAGSQLRSKASAAERELAASIAARLCPEAA